MEAAKVCLGGSTVSAAVVIVVKYRACLSVGRLIVGVQARSFARNSRHSGAISLSMVCGSTVPASDRFRRQIGTESCHRVGSYAYRHEACRVIGVSA